MVDGISLGDDSTNDGEVILWNHPLANPALKSHLGSKVEGIQQSKYDERCYSVILSLKRIPAVPLVRRQSLYQVLNIYKE